MIEQQSITFSERMRGVLDTAQPADRGWIDAFDPKAVLPAEIRRIQSTKRGPSTKKKIESREATVKVRAANRSIVLHSSRRRPSEICIPQAMQYTDDGPGRSRRCSLRPSFVKLYYTIRVEIWNN